MSNEAWAIVAFFAIIVSFLLWVFYMLIQSDKKAKAIAEQAITQSRDFILSLTPRQREIYVKLKGQDNKVIILVLEQRLFELEERLAAFERVNYDDGK